MNVLQLIPAKIRTTLYVVYGLAGLAVTSVAAYYGAINVDGAMPDWVKGVGAALIPLAPVFGATATANVTPDSAESGPGMGAGVDPEQPADVE